ncbi:uncharacterized protein A4U43_C07F39290 [Asparagus officinalis]|uniref:Uncharacterized protein n=1 Tax=Asparagus officinalis TaxID=4686 RepID=A0A5P1EIB6_ASPOF|nr:uncharacterized protein A4U43_C07F39290 [Asparagus officinalis]
MNVFFPRQAEAAQEGHEAEEAEEEEEEVVEGEDDDDEHDADDDEDEQLASSELFPDDSEWGLFAGVRESSRVCERLGSFGVSNANSVGIPNKKEEEAILGRLTEEFDLKEIDLTILDINRRRFFLSLRSTSDESFARLCFFSCFFSLSSVSGEEKQRKDPTRFVFVFMLRSVP